MSEPEDEGFAKASAQFYSLRRRYWLFIVGFMIFGVLQILFINFAPEKLFHWLLAVTLPLILASWAGAMFTWIVVLNWKCPRCGKRFILSWWNSWPGKRCKHCGLELKRESSV
jgi:hypothetical protein